MKINSMPPVSKLEQYKVQRQRNDVRSAAIPGRKDEFEVSDDAALFSDAMKTAKASVAARLNEEGIDVASIKNQIASGSYSVNTDRLAESILMLTGYPGIGNTDND